MSVTAVPLHPIEKGTLTKLWVGVGLVLIAGLALAWFTTRPARRLRLIILRPLRVRIRARNPIERLRFTRLLRWG